MSGKLARIRGSRFQFTRRRFSSRDTPTSLPFKPFFRFEKLSRQTILVQSVAVNFVQRNIEQCDIKKKKKTVKILNIIVHTFLRLVEDPCLIQTLVVNLNDNIKYKTNEVTVNSSKLVTIRIIANDKLLKGSKTRE